MNAERLPLVAVTVGDPAGVGPEIAVRALTNRAIRDSVRGFLIGDAVQIAHVAAACELAADVEPIGAPGDARSDTRIIPVLSEGSLGDVVHGQVRAEYGLAAVSYIERAVELARNGLVDGIVTAPINKEALKAAGSRYPGHTEMLAALFGTPEQQTYTMFTVERLRIFFLTRHHSLARAIPLITTDRVRTAIIDIDRLLRMLGVDHPRIAVAALNPHAGEHGLLGDEEDEIIAPAIDAARETGLDVVGPIPADSVFWQCRQGAHDAVLSLYHDQGHIAAKTLDFFGTVSVTLGLPVIRTSPEHGTAFDIAGSWVANPAGQEAAMISAAQLAPRVLGSRDAMPAGQTEQ
jgi:4-phospho-D-threonate 3-dehydrogenase / 4-phospho-D-erythronate 3-dehydrogenase